MQTFSYQPAPEVIERLRQVTLVAVVGPTAVGKSTLITAAIERNPQDIHLVVVDTTREPRPGERDGIDYNFRSRQHMTETMGERKFVQVAPSVFGDLYATAAHAYATDGVAVMAIIAAAMPDFRALPFKEIRPIFVLPPDYATWQQRIKHHGFDDVQMRRRLVEAEASSVFGVEDEKTQFIINESLDVAIDDFTTLALGKPMGTRLQADQSRGREVVADLLAELRQNLAAPVDQQ